MGVASSRRLAIIFPYSSFGSRSLSKSASKQVVPYSIDGSHSECLDGRTSIQTIRADPDPDSDPDEPVDRQLGVRYSVWGFCR